MLDYDPMIKTITSEILVAYSLCPRKAYLLLYSNEKRTDHEYTHIIEQQKQTTQHKYLDILRRKNIDVQTYSPENFKKGKHEYLINATLKTTKFAAKSALP